MKLRNVETVQESTV